MTNVYPCPYVYASGKTCSGHVVGIEAYKADVSWTLCDGSWTFDFSPRSHYHLTCSEKGNHTGFGREDSDQMKFYLEELPTELAQLVESTGVVAVPDGAGIPDLGG